MDGLEATRHIRHSQSNVLNRAIPIIAMTAHALHGDRETCLEAGMNDYITKPIEPQELLKVLQRWVDEKGVLTPPASSPAAIQAAPEVPQKEQVLVFDRVALMRRLSQDEELAQILTESFLGDLPLQIQKLKDYLQAGDTKAVERQAHTIKGASANLGTDALRIVAAEMEQHARSGDIIAVQEQIAELDAQFERARLALLQEKWTV
jgi:HPt (histidine-containing phosphotransfer) domain-containing protein